MLTPINIKKKCKRDNKGFSMQPVILLNQK